MPVLCASYSRFDWISLAMFWATGASRSRSSVSTVTRNTCLILTDNLPLFTQLLFHFTRIQTFPGVPDNCLKLARHTVDFGGGSRVALREYAIWCPFQRIPCHHVIEPSLHGMRINSHNAI